MSITIDREGARRLVESFTHPGRDGMTRSEAHLSDLADALESAAAGDFAPLAALVGTREVERAPFATEAQVREAIAEAAEAARNLPAPHAETLQRVLAPICRRTQGKCFCGAHGGSVVMAVPAPAPAPDFRDGDVVRVAPDNLEAVVTGPPTAQHPTTARIAAEDGRLYDARLSDLRLVGRRHFRAGERCGTLHKGQARELDGLRGVVQWVDPDDPGVEIVFDGGRVDTLGQRHVAEDTVLAADWTAPEAVEVKS